MKKYEKTFDRLLEKSPLMRSSIQIRPFSFVSHSILIFFLRITSKPPISSETCLAASQIVVVTVELARSKEIESSQTRKITIFFSIKRKKLNNVDCLNTVDRVHWVVPAGNTILHTTSFCIDDMCQDGLNAFVGVIGQIVVMTIPRSCTGSTVNAATTSVARPCRSLFS